MILDQQIKQLSNITNYLIYEYQNEGEIDTDNHRILIDNLNKFKFIVKQYSDSITIEEVQQEENKKYVKKLLQDYDNQNKSNDKLE